MISGVARDNTAAELTITDEKLQTHAFLLTYKAPNPSTQASSPPIQFLQDN
jgi:hypothetical protein